MTYKAKLLAAAGVAFAAVGGLVFTNQSEDLMTKVLTILFFCFFFVLSLRKFLYPFLVVFFFLKIKNSISHPLFFF